MILRSCQRDKLLREQRTVTWYYMVFRLHRLLLILVIMKSCFNCYGGRRNHTGDGTWDNGHNEVGRRKNGQFLLKKYQFMWWLLKQNVVSINCGCWASYSLCSLVFRQVQVLSSGLFLASKNLSVFCLFLTGTLPLKFFIY